MNPYRNVIEGVTSDQLIVNYRCDDLGFILILSITVDLEKVSDSDLGYKCTVQILYLKIRINHTVKIMCFLVCIDQSTRARLKLTQLASFENRFIHENYLLERFKVLQCSVTHVTYFDTIEICSSSPGCHKTLLTT